MSYFEDLMAIRTVFLGDNSGSNNGTSALFIPAIIMSQMSGVMLIRDLKIFVIVTSKDGLAGEFPTQAFFWCNID